MFFLTYAKKAQKKLFKAFYTLSYTLILKKHYRLKSLKSLILNKFIFL